MELGQLLRGPAVLAVAAAAALAGLLATWASGDSAAAVGIGWADVGRLLFTLQEAPFSRFVLPAAFSRFAIAASSAESRLARLAWSAVVGAAAFWNQRLRETGELADYSLLLGVEAFSYLVACDWLQTRLSLRVCTAAAAAAVVARAVRQEMAYEALAVAIGCCFAAVIMRLGRVAQAALPAFPIRVVAGVGFAVSCYCGPQLVLAAFGYMFPVQEICANYATIAEFVGPARMKEMTMELMIDTLHTQVALGYLGVDFTRQGKLREITALQVGEGALPAVGYAKHVVGFILLTAMPYIMQRTLMENINNYHFGLYSANAERALRLEALFPVGAQQHEDSLLAAVASSNLTVGGYVESYNNVLSSSYRIVERRVFSIPKIALMPGMLLAKPSLLVTVLPACLALDAGKAAFTTLLSNSIEAFRREQKDLENRRQRIEQHDTKNEEVIRLSEASGLTRKRWETLSAELQLLSWKKESLETARSFTDWLYWQDMMIPGIEVALAYLLEMGYIRNVDLFLYIRVVEDAIDLALTRSRVQATLASMETDAKRLAELQSGLAQQRSRSGVNLTCATDALGGSLRFRDLEFARGATLHVRIPALDLPSGRVYAVTGANGAGKSTAFGILAGCANIGGATPEGTNGSIILPSEDVVVVTQQLYCPLFVKPLSWLLHVSDLAEVPEDIRKKQEARILELSAQLYFHMTSEGAPSERGVRAEELHTEKEDWYDTLSGGQRIKMELIRQVFLRDSCPQVLLLDEVFAPLDPSSKAAVQKALKKFCASSLLLVIYHQGVDESCLAADDFFDERLHFENGTASFVGTC